MKFPDFFSMLNETEKNDSVVLVRVETIAFSHPKLDDVVIEEAKALGINFEVDLKNELLDAGTPCLIWPPLRARQKLQSVRCGS